MKCVSTSPSSNACWFIIATKSSAVAPTPRYASATWRAIAQAALFPDGYIIPRISVSRLTTSPSSSGTPLMSAIVLPPIPASVALIVT